MKETSFYRPSLAMVLVMCVMAWSFLSCSTNKLTKEQKAVLQARTMQQIDDAVRQRDFTIEVFTMTPKYGPQKHLSSAYSLRVSGDSLYSYLPYVGTAYAVPYGGGQGLIFDDVIRSYDVTLTKKNVYQINLSVRNYEDDYHYFIEVYSNGKSYIKVWTRQRDQIDFSGEMSLKN